MLKSGLISREVLYCQRRLQVPASRRPTFQRRSTATSRTFFVDSSLLAESRKRRLIPTANIRNEGMDYRRKRARYHVANNLVQYLNSPRNRGSSNGLAVVRLSQAFQPAGPSVPRRERHTLSRADKPHLSLTRENCREQRT